MRAFVLVSWKEVSEHMNFCSKCAQNRLAAWNITSSFSAVVVKCTFFYYTFHLKILCRNACVGCLQMQTQNKLSDKKKGIASSVFGKSFLSGIYIMWWKKQGTSSYIPRSVSSCLSLSCSKKTPTKQKPNHCVLWNIFCSNGAILSLELYLGQKFAWVTLQII